MHADGNAKVVSLAEAAEILGVHYMTAYRWVRTGLMPATKPGGQWIVNVADLRAPERAKPGRRKAEDAALGESSAGVTNRTGRLAKRLMAGDEPGSWAILEDARATGFDPSEVHEQLIGRAMFLVGEQWKDGTVTVAQEHRAAAVAIRLIGRLGPSFRRPGRTRATVLVGTIEGDRHSLPVSLLADMLREKSLDVIDVAADVPVQDIAAMVPLPPFESGVVNVIALCSTLQGNRRTKPMLAMLRSLRPGVPILLGGAAVRDEKHARQLGADGWTGASASAAVKRILEVAVGRSEVGA
ncbi:MAG: excisionase family DNA binding protein [Glaciecola sp.]|jgi:excisionase family DNA binding protein